MASPWRIVDLLGFDGKVSAKSGQLHLDGECSIPLADLLALLVGPKCLVHESTFERAAATGFTIVHCDWRGSPIAASYGWSQNSLAGARHRQQADLSAPRQKQGWRHIVQAKIRGQAANLKTKDGVGYSKLLEIARKVPSGDSNNCEAQAARLYWTRFAGNKEFRRIPGAGYGLNGRLDYGYAILRSVCLRAVVAAGLTPAIGIFHRRRDNPFSLADDVIEPFRPAVDWLALKSMRVGEGIDPEVRRMLASGLDSRFDRSVFTIGSSIMRFAQNLANYIEGSVPTLEVPTFIGFDED